MLKNFFKICLHLILVFVILTTLVFLLRELLFVSIKFLIGLRESFIQSTRFGKLYLIMLYSFMFYICFELSYFANIIRSRKNTLIEKYFSDKENEGVNKYKMILMMLCIYISICLVGFSFYGFTGGKWNEANAANIINIFIWATYLVAPIVAIWVFSDWRVQFNKKEEISRLKTLKNICDEIQSEFNSIRCKIINITKVSYSYIDMDMVERNKGFDQKINYNSEGVDFNIKKLIFYRDSLAIKYDKEFYLKIHAYTHYCEQINFMLDDMLNEASLPRRNINVPNFENILKRRVKEKCRVVWYGYSEDFMREDIKSISLDFFQIYQLLMNSYYTFDIYLTEKQKV
ncbi:hypothetical protein [Acinetobacter proteolyticus]|uniref:hypothetical protein n=1 Tax=Acinetobacter proteolyticus TaxID=1776741 RepID=UPI0031D58A29